jgi:hypothetical protein
MRERGKGTSPPTGVGHATSRMLPASPSDRENWTMREQQEPYSDTPARYELIDILDWSMWVGALLGVGAGIWAASAKFGKEPSVLLTAVGAAVGLLAVTVTAMTVVIVFLPLTRALGVRKFFRPFVVVGVVSAEFAARKSALTA